MTLPLLALCVVSRAEQRPTKVRWENLSRYVGRSYLTSFISSGTRKTGVARYILSGELGWVQKVVDFLVGTSTSFLRYSGMNAVSLTRSYRSAVPSMRHIVH